jgi:hypothetical protein
MYRRDRSLLFQFDCNSGLFFSEVYFSLLTKSMARVRRHQGPADILQYATGACEARNGGNNQDNVRLRVPLNAQLPKPPCSHC